MAQELQRGAARSNCRAALRSRRRAKTVISYKEPSSDIDLELGDGSSVSQSDDESEPYEEELPLIRSQQDRANSTRSARSTRRRRRRSPSTSPPPTSERPTKKRATRRQISPHVPQSTTAPHGEERQSAGVIPPWHDLPYHILLEIFSYASYPLYDERDFQATSSVDWLVKVARLCRSFAEPAITALYRSPPLLPMVRAHKLCRLLTADQDRMAYNYRAKIERLQIEVSQTATYTLQGYGLLDLSGLVRNCPRLMNLEIFHGKDMPPYRDLDDMIKFNYPPSLFHALRDSAVRLRSWRWNSRMAGNQSPIDKLREIHMTHNFNGLRKLCFVNYPQFLSRKDIEDSQQETTLAESLAVLPNLECLIFESSTLLNAKLLPLLPRNLKHVEFTNCCDLESEDMATFLVTHGSHLRSLVLNHNQSLSLSFLQVLGSACQNLTVLKMNLTYYSTLMTYRDSEPLYDKLIGDGEIPQWPPTLQELELTHLRHWDISSARMFFQSLVGSAARLLDLRRITIKAILNTSWRDRVKFRDAWVPRLERVFKRPYVPPAQHLRTLGAAARNQGRDQLQSPIVAEESRPHPPPRYLTRSRSSITIDDSDGEDEQEQGGETLKREARHSARLALLNPPRVAKRKDVHPSQNEMKRMRAISRELASLRGTASNIRHVEDDATSEDIEGTDSNGESSSTRTAGQRDNGQHKEVEFVQGMCNVVNITIDNLRPAETQFVEADFLDSEPEDDEDWDGT